MSIPCVVWRIEPSDQCEVAKEKDVRANYTKHDSRASSSSPKVRLSLPLSERSAPCLKNRWSIATNAKRRQGQQTSATDPIFCPTAVDTHRTPCLSFDRWERNERRRSRPHSVVR